MTSAPPPRLHVLRAPGSRSPARASPRGCRRSCTWATWRGRGDLLDRPRPAGPPQRARRRRGRSPCCPPRPTAGPGGPGSPGTGTAGRRGRAALDPRRWPRPEAGDARASASTPTAEAGVSLRTTLTLDPHGVLAPRHAVTQHRRRGVLDVAGVLAVRAAARGGRRDPRPHRALVPRAVAPAPPAGPRRRVRESRRGRTGHDATLLLVAGTAGFGFSAGEVLAATSPGAATTSPRRPAARGRGPPRRGAGRRRAAARRRGAPGPGRVVHHARGRSSSGPTRAWTG